MKIAVTLMTAMFGMLVVGFVNAGSGPIRSRAIENSGSACQQKYVMQAESGGCCSQVLLQPVYKGGCASSSRVTLAERSIARRAARANFEKTQAAMLAAAAKGDLQVPSEGPELTTMAMIPVEESSDE